MQPIIVKTNRSTPIAIVHEFESQLVPDSLNISTAKNVIVFTPLS